MASIKEHRLQTPLTDVDVSNLMAGDIVYLTGRVFTARDKAHKEINGEAGKAGLLPFDFSGGVLYHCGPLAKSEGGNWRIVSAGPTTSARMNSHESEVIEKLSIRAIIGKGGMDEAVSAALQKNGCVYLAYTGGAGALAASKIKSVSGVHWLDLGMAEAVWELEVADFGPLIVAMDSHGGSLYKQ